MADRETILQMLGSGPVRPMPQPDPTPSQELLPATSRVLGEGSSGAFPPVSQQIPSGLPSIDQVREEARQAPVLEVPEATARITGMERGKLALRRDPQAQVKFLEGIVGEGRVRQDREGDFEVLIEPGDERAPGPMSKPTWMRVDELGFASKDLMDASMGAIETIGGIAAALATRGRSAEGALARWVKNIAVPTAGSQAAGATTDVGIAMLDKTPVDLSKIGEERLQKGALEAAFGTGLAGAVKVLGRAYAPFGAEIGDLRLDMRRAADYFADRGIAVYQPTVGELTGSSLLGRIEAHTEKSVGGAGPIRALAEKNYEALRSIQRYMMGEAPGLSDESVGRELIDTVMTRVKGVEDAMELARRGGETAAQRGIFTTVGKLTQPMRELYEREVSQGIRQRVVALRDASKARADQLFEDVRRQPGGEGRVLGAAGLQKRFDEILEKLPAAQGTVTEPTGLVSASGAPITSETIKDVTLKEFVPENILSRLRSISSLEDPKVSLQDLQQMRREVYDDIAKGQGVPGLGTHYLADIGDAITKTIDEEITKLPGGTLKQSLQRANEWYKTKVVPFNRKGVTELFINPDEPGYVGDIALVNRVINDPDQWTLIKETVGQNAPEFTRLRRLVVDRILENSTFDGKDLIDASKLIQNLESFRRKAGNRELADDVFTSPRAIDNLVEFGKTLKLFQGAKLTADEAAEILSNPKIGIDDIRGFIDKQKAFEAEYANVIKRDIRDGVLNRNVNPSNFVSNYILSDKVSPDDLKNVVGLLNEDTLSRVRAKTMETLMNRGTSKVLPADIGRAVEGDEARRVSATGLFKQISTGTEREKLRAVLGEEKFEDFAQYLKLEAGRQAKEEAFAAAGGISAGFQIQNILALRLLTFLPRATYNNLVGRLIASKSFRSWMGNLTPEETPGFIASLTASGPFIADVLDEFKDETDAKAYLVAVRDAAMRGMANQLNSPSDPFSRQLQEQQISRQQLEEMLKRK